ncbi:beta-phosphoglucomutase family hydrolase [Mucilaginibacter koreensis]
MDHQAKYERLVKLSQGDFKAFLYDCDGTLADNMQAHKDSYIRVAADKGVMMDGAIIDEFAGLPITQVIGKINERYNATLDPDEFYTLKYRLFYDEYIEHTQPIEYVVNHLKSHAGKVRIGVVSGSSRATVEKTLSVLGILNLVEVLVCSGDTGRGKPYPDPFLAAAEQLGVPPHQCLVFEDGNAGVEAAKAAGMEWIRIDQI